MHRQVLLSPITESDVDHSITQQSAAMELGDPVRQPVIAQHHLQPALSLQLRAIDHQFSHHRQQCSDLRGLPRTQVGDEGAEAVLFWYLAFQLRAPVGHRPLDAVYRQAQRIQPAPSIQRVLRTRPMNTAASLPVWSVRINAGGHYISTPTNVGQESSAAVMSVCEKSSPMKSNGSPATSAKAYE